MEWRTGPRLAALAAAAVIALAPPALAQTCQQLSLSQTCLMRGVPHDDRRVAGVGGDVVCASYSGAPAALQYDRYTFSGGYMFYVCTMFRSCAWAQSNDPKAYGDFC